MIEEQIFLNAGAFGGALFFLWKMYSQMNFMIKQNCIEMRKVIDNNTQAMLQFSNDTALCRHKNHNT